MSHKLAERGMKPCSGTSLGIGGVNRIRGLHTASSSRTTQAESYKLKRVRDLRFFVVSGRT